MHEFLCVHLVYRIHSLDLCPNRLRDKAIWKLPLSIGPTLSPHHDAEKVITNAKIRDEPTA